MTQQAHIISLPRIADGRGNLSIIEQLKNIPFVIRRAYWIYDVPGGYARGEHAYKQNEEFIVALSGSFDVELDDGNEKRVFSLNRSYNGVFVPKGTWRKMLNFSTNSLALVLASMPFDVNDYVFNYKEFLLWKRGEIAETHSPNTPAQDVPAMLSSAFTIDCKRLVTVFDCSLYQLTREQHPEGSLTFVYEKVHVPFAINRVFYSYDIPSGEDRGAHAHRHCHQLIIAASGSFEVVLDDGVNKRERLRQDRCSPTRSPAPKGANEPLKR